MVITISSIMDSICCYILRLHAVYLVMTDFHISVYPLYIFFTR